MADKRDAAGLEAAAATLVRGARFLGAGLRTPLGPSTRAPLEIAGPHRDRVIGHGLREIDRFLSLLIDEVAIAVAPSAPDLIPRPRPRNTANKLRALRAAMALSSPDHDRLLAVGRLRECLFHCGGLVRVGDSRTSMSMTAGWLADCNSRKTFAIGERLSLSPCDLRSVCDFYERIAAGLIMDLVAFLDNIRRAPAGLVDRLASCAGD